MAAIAGELVREYKNSPIDAIEVISSNKPINAEATWPKSRCVPNNKEAGIKVINIKTCALLIYFYRLPCGGLCIEHGIGYEI